MGRVDNRPVNQPSVPLPPARPPQADKPPLPSAATAPPADALQSNLPQGQAVASVSLEPQSNPTTHKVQAKESLSTIAQKYFGNPNLYLDLYNANREILSHPNQIRQGMVLKLPAHLFPQPDQPVSGREPSLAAYRQQHPLSYLTLSRSHDPEVEARTPLGPLNSGLMAPNLLDYLFSPTSLAQKQPEENEALNDLGDAQDRARDGMVTHDDAVKVNKRFDITPDLKATTLGAKFGSWAKDVAGILRANQASIRLPNAKGEPVTLSPELLEQLAGKPIEEVKAYFKQTLGIALMNTLWAIDDVTADMQHDPYYADVKDRPKTIDLASVAERFNLLDDKLDYMAKTAAHRHKQVPILLQGPNAVAHARGPAQSTEQILAGLAKHFNAKGVLTDPAAFEAEVYKLLDNQSARRQLVQHFGLNSRENINMLAPSITSEGGMTDRQRTYNNYFAVGSVMLNRALGRNLRKAAAHTAQGKPAAQFKPVSMREIIFEKGQFEITWRQMPNGGGKTFFEHMQGLNQAFLQNKLGKSPTTREAFETAYEAARDLISGMHHLEAEVNGRSQKNSGRSTAELFYFNQSRSQDYSQSDRAAVSLIDSNNTHVFFKEWDNRAYFRD